MKGSARRGRKTDDEYQKAGRRVAVASGDKASRGDAAGGVPEAAGISQNQLALDLRVPANRIGQIVRRLRGITPETALRLARHFGNSPEFWLNLPQMVDLSAARQASAKKIENEVRPLKRSA
jgi:addiction module HigA family antidote